MTTALEKKRRPRNRVTKTRDPKTIRLFLEELSWVLSAYPNLDYRGIPDVIEDMQRSKSLPHALSNFVPENPNIHFLVGVLPKVFGNADLFRTNEDLVSFARSAMKLKMTRWQKKSREELIGQIVCAAYQLNDRKLDRLVRALSRIINGDGEASEVLKKSKATKLSWNYIIQQLAKERA